MTDKESAKEELPRMQQAKVWFNDLKSIPIFLALGVAYILVGTSPELAVWLFMVFIAERYCHTLFYLTALQPGRTIAYGVGIVCLIDVRSGRAVASLSSLV